MNGVYLHDCDCERAEYFGLSIEDGDDDEDDEDDNDNGDGVGDDDGGLPRPNECIFDAAQMGGGILSIIDCVTCPIDCALSFESRKRGGDAGRPNSNSASISCACADNTQWFTLAHIHTPVNFLLFVLSFAVFFLLPFPAHLAPPPKKKQSNN